MMNLLVTICARAGSKGVKCKNVREFLGVPISYYTLAAYKLFCEKHGTEYESVSLAINTDSDELCMQAKNAGLPFALIRRKEALAGDIVSKTDVIRDTVKEMEREYGVKYDIVLDLDITSPLRTAQDINGTISALRANESADVAFSLTSARRSPYFNMVKLKDDGSYETVVKSDYVTRQQTPTCFDMNASIYAYRNEFITDENTKRVFDGKAAGYQMMDTAVLDIDSEEDFDLMEVLARHFYEKCPDYGMVERTARFMHTKKEHEV